MCSFHDRVLAKNDVNENEKKIFFSNAECFSLVGVCSLGSARNELHKRSKEQGTAESAKRDDNNKEAREHIDFVVEFLLRFENVKCFSLRRAKLLYCCRSFGS